MTYYGSTQMAASFRTVRKHTIQIAQDIPEEQYGFVAADGVRSVARLLVHMAVAPALFWRAMHESRQTDLGNFDFFAVLAQLTAEEATPRTKEQIIDLLAREGEAFASFLESMPEPDLAQMVTTPTSPAPKSRFEMLLGAKEHEMHHRAQLMLIQRQLGIVPHLTRQMNAMMEQMKARAAGA